MIDAVLACIHRVRMLGPIIVILDNVDCSAVRDNVLSWFSMIFEHVHFFLNDDYRSFARDYSVIQGLQDVRENCIVFLSRATARGFDIKFAVTAFVISMIRPLTLAEY